MPNAEDILWFKQQFGTQIEAAVQGTPFTVDMLTAIACQETGYIWQVLRRRNLSMARILELCVGDTIDAKPNGKGRSAFPKNKAELLSQPNGQQMFDIARQALVDMAEFIPGYQGVASQPKKFCRGFGLFQYDLQFFLKEPDYFLERRYADFSATLEKAVGELRVKLKRLGWEDKTSLTELEMAGVAIAYNTGGYNPQKGLQQGYFDGTRFYGENYFDFLRLSKSVVVPHGDAPVEPSEPTPGVAPLPPPTPVAATGKLYAVDVHTDPLRLRREPKIDKSNPTANVIARLPDGHLVQAVSDAVVNGFREVETSLLGAHFHGFASADHLKPVKPASGVEAVPVFTPAEASVAAGGLVAVYMPRKPSTPPTRRKAPANAHTLNEDEQTRPTRKGTTPEKLRAELGDIVEWLAVDKASHKRYQPRDGSTFCNIYAHDFCHLAGVYLPRVWWSPAAIEALALGQSREPVLDQTIDEQRANDLFRWLRDFGLRFGWRQTGTLTKLQVEVNQGAVGLIVARRKVDGLSGHIVAVVPETPDHQARRNSAGEVIAPLQSQAGAENFRYGTGKPNWWKDAKFADSAFWLHS